MENLLWVWDEIMGTRSDAEKLTGTCWG